MAAGRKTGGRRKGSRNRKTLEREALAAAGIKAALADGVSPLDVVLRVMRGGPEADAVSERQYAAAVAALPYAHPRLAATYVATAPAGGSPLTHEQRLALLEAGPGAAIEVEAP